MEAACGDGLHAQLQGRRGRHRPHLRARARGSGRVPIRSVRQSVPLATREETRRRRRRVGKVLLEAIEDPHRLGGHDPRRSLRASGCSPAAGILLLATLAPQPGRLGGELAVLETGPQHIRGHSLGRLEFETLHAVWADRPMAHHARSNSACLRSCTCLWKCDVRRTLFGRGREGRVKSNAMTIRRGALATMPCAEVMSFRRPRRSDIGDAFGRTVHPLDILCRQPIEEVVNVEHSALAARAQARYHWQQY